MTYVLDWLKLRQEHRILGECIGCLAKKPRQDVLLGLPVLLLPEEAKLLVETKIARLIKRPILKETPSESLKKKFEEYRNKLFTDQQQCLIDGRRSQVLRIVYVFFVVKVSIKIFRLKNKLFFQRFQL